MNYYILSLKHSPAQGFALWWGPCDCGYTAELDMAGTYTEAQVNAQPDYYNNGKTTVAIPVEKAIGVCVRQVHFKAAKAMICCNPKGPRNE